MTMENQNAPKLTPEQATALKKMLTLAKYSRRVFFISIIIGAILSLVSSFVKSEVGSALLIAGFAMLIVTIICAIVMYWNFHRIKRFCKSAGIDF